jgi:arylsulfatase A-like enzyme
LEKLYNAEVAYVDSEVGKLLGSLKSLDLEDNTVVVITSDHGEEFLDHGGFEHGHTLYDELLRVPLIIKDPDSVSAGDDSSENRGANTAVHQVSTVVRLIDIAPTLCELAGIGIHEKFKGTSLVGLLRGETEPSRPVLSEGNMWGPGGSAWRRGTWKVIRQETAPEMQLFNIALDLGERNNVADKDPRQAKIMAQELSLAIKENKVNRSRGKATRLNPEEIERLRSLGYMQ